MNPSGVCMAPYQGPRGQNTQGLLHKRLGVQLPPDQERVFWREEIRKLVTYWNAAPGEQEPDTRPVPCSTAASRACAGLSLIPGE